jgi:diamine N-acetyltransferase
VTPSSSRAAGSEVTLTLASVGDAAQLARTAGTLFEQTFGEANTPEDMAAYVAVAFSEARQRDELADDRNRIWLARAPDSSIVGYAKVRLDSPAPGNSTAVRAAEIARLYADRAWHGHGLGAWLMHTCIAVAREHHANLLWLGVWERNARAIAFYEKQGFRVIGEQSFMLGADRQRDLVMALDLTTE